MPVPAMVSAAQPSGHASSSVCMHEAHEDGTRHVAEQDLATLLQGVMRDVVTADAVRLPACLPACMCIDLLRESVCAHRKARRARIAAMQHCGEAKCALSTTLTAHPRW